MAQAYTDPQIVNFYQRNAPTSRVRALILFKNTIEASSFRFMNVSPNNARNALLQNAAQAQARVTAMLKPKGIVATPESQSVRRYWV